MQTQPEKTARLHWFEFIKAFALLWIFINHLAEIFFGYPLIGNPSAEWGTLSERIAQLTPFTNFGIVSFPLNVLRYVGWIGDQGVQLFLIASGFGLTWGYLARNTTNIVKKDFYLNRAFRLYPLWWGAHVLFAGVWLVTGWGLSPGNLSFYLSALGIRFTPQLLYYFSPAWWYFGLILQLYLLYPFLWDMLRRFGPSRFLTLTLGLSLPVRALGLFVFQGYLDTWQRGGIFITRLPEFVFGMCFAVWLYQDSANVLKTLRNVRTVVFLGIAYFAGLALSLTLWGMAVAPFVLGVSVFLLLYVLFDALMPRMPRVVVRAGDWLGEHSYSLYLIHHPVFLRVLQLGAASMAGLLVRSILAVVLTFVLAIALEWAVGFGVHLLEGNPKAFKLRVTLLGVLFGGASVLILLFVAEQVTRRYEPQEIYGWGERPSLQVNDELGWTLIPSQTTHLRWQSYDYVVTANKLGFPAPDVEVEKPAGVFRVLVTGDAFTSAEGVDTEQSWARLLQPKLTNAEVMNFAITGYGPNQYAQVVEMYAPTYKPDLIVVEMFVNDFLDVRTTNEEFQASIGFGQPDASGVGSVLRLENLRQYVKLNMVEQAGEWFGKPSATGYFLGNFAYFETAQAETMQESAGLIAERLQAIQMVANEIHAQVVVVLVPAPIQACAPSDLKYYPAGVDFEDTDLYDPEQPQRLLAEVTSELGIRLYDLRPAFAEADGCLYQANNMHWTVAGHEMIAQYLADRLRGDVVAP